MDVYPYCHVGPDGSLTTNELHRQGFPRLLWDVLQRFGNMEKLNYRGCVFHEFKIRRCEVCVDIPLNTKQLSWIAWSMSATRHDVSDTLEMVAHQALEMFCEKHLSDTVDTPNSPSRTGAIRHGRGA
jgi:hypothetical protein